MKHQKIDCQPPNIYTVLNYQQKYLEKKPQKKTTFIGSDSADVVAVEVKMTV